MKYLKISNLNTTYAIYYSENLRLQLKYLAYNVLLPNWLRQYAFASLWLLHKKTSFVFWRKQCVVTNNMKFIVTFFKMYRMQLKMFMSKGLVNGLRRAIW